VLQLHKINQQAGHPPSITSGRPLIISEALDARYMNPPNKSSTFANLFNGILSNTSFLNDSSSNICFVIGVSKKVGAIALTFILYLAHSIESAFVNCVIPPLLAEYAALL